MNFVVFKTTDENQTELDKELGIHIRNMMNSEKIDNSVFYHSKLNANLLKSIKDPYKLVTGGISESLQ